MKKLVRRGLLLLVFLLALQLLAGVTTALADPGWHQVLPGQTLYSIGRMYGVNPYTIAAMNGLANPNYIRAYQWLYVPSGGGWQSPYCGYGQGYYGGGYSYWPSGCYGGYYGGYYGGGYYGGGWHGGPH
jgi:hypothetical protein